MQQIHGNKQCVRNIKFQERSSSVMPFSKPTEKPLADFFAILGYTGGIFVLK